jgi:hypothetical protein
MNDIDPAFNPARKNLPEIAGHLTPVPAAPDHGVKPFQLFRILKP